MAAPNRPTPEIDLSDSQRHLRLDPDAVCAMARRVLQLEGVETGTLSIAVVDDRAIHEVNRRYLDHDCPTDVISFPLSEPDDSTFSGELVISAETAAAVAARVGIDPDAEFALYLVHGLLHLRGYDDRTDAERAHMRRREDEILEALEVAPPPRDAGPRAVPDRVERPVGVPLAACPPVIPASHEHRRARRQGHPIQSSEHRSSGAVKSGLEAGS